MIAIGLLLSTLAYLVGLWLEEIYNHDWALSICGFLTLFGWGLMFFGLVELLWIVAP